VARCEEGDRGGHMAEDNRRKGRKTRDNWTRLFGERLTWKGAGHMASGQVDDEKEGGPCGPKRGGGWMTHGSMRKVERKMT
jgi:hypothetical protein